MKNLVLLFLSSMILFSCEFKDVDFNGIESYKVESFANNELLLKLAFKLNNENGFKIKVKPSKLNVFVEGQEMGIAYLDKKVVFKKKSEGVYETKLRFKLADGAMFSAMKFIGKKQLNVRFLGKVKGSVFGLSKKFPVDETKTIDASKLNLGQFMGK